MRTFLPSNILFWAKHRCSFKSTCLGRTPEQNHGEAQGKKFASCLLREIISKISYRRRVSASYWPSRCWRLWPPLKTRVGTTTTRKLCAATGWSASSGAARTPAGCAARTTRTTARPRRRGARPRPLLCYERNGKLCKPASYS